MADPDPDWWVEWSDDQAALRERFANDRIQTLATIKADWLGMKRGALISIPQAEALIALWKEKS